MFCWTATSVKYTKLDFSTPQTVWVVFLNDCLFNLMSGNSNPAQSPNCIIQSFLHSHWSPEPFNSQLVVGVLLWSIFYLPHVIWMLVLYIDIIWWRHTPLQWITSSCTCWSKICDVFKCLFRAHSQLTISRTGEFIDKYISVKCLPYTDIDVSVQCFKERHMTCSRPHETNPPVNFIHKFLSLIWEVTHFLPPSPMQAPSLSVFLCPPLLFPHPLELLLFPPPLGLYPPLSGITFRSYHKLK